MTFYNVEETNNLKKNDKPTLNYFDNFNHNKNITDHTVLKRYTNKNQSDVDLQ